MQFGNYIVELTKLAAFAYCLIEKQSIKFEIKF
jgi:hypothetical protein